MSRTQRNAMRRSARSGIATLAALAAFLVVAPAPFSHALAGEVTILKFAEGGGERIETATGTLVVLAPLSVVRDVARGVRKGTVDVVRVGDLRIEACESEGGPWIRGKAQDGREVLVVGAD